MHQEDFATIFKLCRKNTKFDEIKKIFPGVKGNVLYAINSISRQIEEYYKSHLTVEQMLEREEKDKRKSAYRFAEYNGYYTTEGEVDVDRAYRELYESTQEELPDNSQQEEYREEEDKWAVFDGLKWEDEAV